MNKCFIEVRECAGSSDPKAVGVVALYGKDSEGTEFGLVYPNKQALLQVLINLTRQGIKVGNPKN